MGVHYGPAASTARPSSLDNRHLEAFRRPTTGPFVPPSPQLSIYKQPGRQTTGFGHDSTCLAACCSQEADDCGPPSPPSLQGAFSASSRPSSARGALLYGRPSLEPGICTLSFSRCRLVPSCRFDAADLRLMAAILPTHLPAHGMDLRTRVALDTTRPTMCKRRRVCATGHTSIESDAGGAKVSAFQTSSCASH